MNYKLSKELKEAEFPFRPGITYYSQYGSVATGNREPTIITNDRLPTLSELIEECGEKFIELEKIGTDWWCKGDWEKYGGGECPKYDVKGSTPEEAVGRLWLALNGKP